MALGTSVLRATFSTTGRSTTRAFELAADGDRIPAIRTAPTSPATTTVPQAPDRLTGVDEDRAHGLASGPVQAQLRGVPPDAVLGRQRGPEGASVVVGVVVVGHRRATVVGPPAGRTAGRIQFPGWTAALLLRPTRAISGPRCRHSPSPSADATSWVTLPSCGAVVTFIGTARDHAAGRPGVHRLEYEAYEGPAVRRLEALAGEIRVRWPEVGRIALLHRTGVVELGDAAVVVAVSAPHRDGGVRGGPLRDRRAEAHRAHLEARVVGRGRELGPRGPGPHRSRRH